MLHPKVLLPALALILAAPPATAADKSAQMLQSFYLQFTNFIQGGNKDSPAFVCLSIPGKALRPLSSTNPDDVTYINKLFDVVTLYSPVWTPTDQTVSAVYGLAVQHNAVPQAPPLAGEELARYQKAVASLDPAHSDAMKAYNTCTLALATAYDVRDSEKIGNISAGHGATVSNLTKAKVAQAESDMANPSVSHAVEIKDALGEVTKVANANPATWFQSLSDLYNSGKMGDSFTVETYPKCDIWLDDSDWTTFTFKSSTSTSSLNTSSKSVEASLSIEKGGFHGSASGGWSKDTTDDISNDDSLTISLQAKRVEAQRPWMQRALFSNKIWSFDAGNRGTVISDGHGKGIMPLIVDSIIIIRNVKFTGKSIGKHKHEMEQSIHAETEFGWGPVSFNGGYKQHDHTLDTNDSKDAMSITIPDPQIGAYICTPVPASPSK